MQAQPQGTPRVHPSQVASTQGLALAHPRVHLGVGVEVVGVEVVGVEEEVVEEEEEEEVVVEVVVQVVALCPCWLYRGTGPLEARAQGGPVLDPGACAAPNPCPSTPRTTAAAATGMCPTCP